MLYVLLAVKNGILVIYYLYFTACVPYISRMSRNEEIMRLVKSWAEKIGHRTAIKRLVNRNIAVTTADKLCAGRYESVPRDLLAETLLEEMAKDGFALTGEAS